MKISYIHGICIKNDAISNSIRDEITWLGSEVRNDVHFYTYSCDHENLPFTKVNDLRDVAFDQHFQASDLVVFHFGIYYPLFDLLAVTPKRAKRLVVFHNITPKQFLSAENHSTIDKSFRQMANVVFADHVACVSLTNLDVLRQAGIQTPATILPLAVHSDFQTPESKPSAVDGLIRLVFIGRFVRSKGPEQLLEAVRRILERNQSVRLKLDMVGNLSFADQGLLEEIHNAVEKMHCTYRDRIKVTLQGNASEEVKHHILHEADLFVLPTYHEGFCVPIVEALASGCKVIAYENSNTPAISGGLARLTPTGDVEALSCAIEEAVKELASSAWRGNGIEGYSEYSRKAQQYARQYSPEQTKRRFLDFISSFTNSH